MRKIYEWVTGSMFFMLAGIGLAMAELPAVVGTTLTGLQTDGLALVALVWPVVGAIVGGFILIKLFKRGANKI